MRLGVWTFTLHLRHTDPTVMDILALAQTATLSPERLDQSVQLLGQALFQVAEVVGMSIAWCGI